MKYRLFCFKFDPRKGGGLEYTACIFCWMHHGHNVSLLLLLQSDLYTKAFGEELSLLEFC